MKKIAIALLSATAISAASMAAVANTSKAATSGFYVIGGAGVGQMRVSSVDYSNLPALLLHDGSANAPTSIDTKSHYFLWKLGAGYKINNMFAIEGDFTVLPSLKVAKDADKGVVKNKDGNITTDNYSFALMGKVMCPVTSAITLYAKAGGAYDMYTAADLLTDKDTISFNKQTIKSGEKVSQIVPVVGLGATYAVNSHVGVGVDGVYSFAIKKMPSWYGATVDLSYNF